MKVSSILVAFCVYAAAARGASAQVPMEKSSVRVVVLDMLGMPIEDARLVLTSVGPNEKFPETSKVGGEAKFEGVPFGIYDLEVRMPGFVTRKAQIRIYQSALTFQIGLEVAVGHSYVRPVVLGTLSGVKNSSDLWVRLLPVYSSDLIENAVNSEGKFEFAGMETGPYVLLVFQKDKLVATKPINVLAKTQEVTLALEK